MLWLVLLAIVAFLAGTFVYSYRLLKGQSRREQDIDPARLRPWDEDD